MTEKIKVLDLGCGTFPYKAGENEEVTSVDFRPEVSPTVVHNLFHFPYPFRENSFDIIYASHIIEHMKENVEFMEEIYRIANPGAKVIMRVPHFSGRSAWCDPTHLRAYSYSQFYYYSSDSRDHYGNCEFKVEKIRLRYTRFDHGFLVSKILSPVINFLANLSIEFCERTWCYWVGGFSELYVELRVVK